MNRKVVWLLAIATPLALLIAASTLLVSKPDTEILEGVTTAEFHIDVGLTTLYSLFYFMAAGLFIIGLEGFKKNFKKAYAKVCIGMTLQGITFLQLPVITLLGFWGSTWVTSGAIALPFVLATLSTFWGIHAYGKLINLRSRWHTWRFALSLAVASAIASIWLPHVSMTLPEGEFDLSVGLRVCFVVLFTAATVAVLRLKQQSGPAYTNALAWLFVSMILTVVSFVAATIFILLGIDDEPTAYNLLNAWGLVSALALLRAGYAFTKIHDY